VWLVPAVGLAAAFAVAHHARLTLLIAISVAITAMVVPQIGSWTTDPVASREIARIVEQTRARGHEPCATGSNAEVLAGYTDAVRAVTTPAEIGGCDLLFGIPQTSGALLGQLACRFAAHTVLPGTVSIVVTTQPVGSRPVPC
jgi:hypothetical protein